MKKPKIHFICNGNIYRSRLAEAYTKSLRLQNIEISSSGLAADKYDPDFISTWSLKIAAENNLTKWLNKYRQQTTKLLLDNNDLLIFMSKRVFDKAKMSYDFDANKAIVWNVKDATDWQFKLTKIQKQQRTIRNIKKRVDSLLGQINKAGWVDIVNENNKPLNYCLPLIIANKKGLWHRGCHAVITTPDNKFLVQKRSNSIVLSPGRLDISLGGHVDAGEHPGFAIIREIKEEVGLKIDQQSTRLLSITKWNSYHPKYCINTKAFIYNYHVKLFELPFNNKLQTSEVSAIYFMPPKQLAKLIKMHGIKRIGRLNYPYVYYKKLIELTNL